MEKILIIERNILNPECCSFLKQKGYDVTKIDFSDAPTFNQRSFVNKYLNIFLRVVFQYKNYLYKAERKFNKKQRSKLVTQFCKKNTTQFDKVIAERQYSLVEKLYSENAWKNLLKNIYQKADSKQHCISNFSEDDFYNTENEIMLSKIAIRSSFFIVIGKTKVTAATKLVYT